MKESVHAPRLPLDASVCACGRASARLCRGVGMRRRRRAVVRRETSASLDGTYEITVAEADATESGGATPGLWTLTIDSEDATLAGPEGRSPPLAPTTLSETEMVLPPDPMCRNDGEPSEGVYDVELSGDSLEFTKVSDSCGDRAFTLTTYTWQRKTP